MEGQGWLAGQFEDNRSRLRRVAIQMLGSESEAVDAGQETWLRLSRQEAGVINNLGGWLTTVVGRICLDMLRSRKARREDSLSVDGKSELDDNSEIDPEREAILADTIGPALIVVLDMLTPPERVAFVLHDMFEMPFEEIAPIVGRSPTAARQLASRARRRLRGTTEDSAARRSNSDGGRQNERRIVDAFLAAARNAEFEALISLLHPECVLRSDEFAALIGTPKKIEGGSRVAEFFNGTASAAVRTTIGGVAGAAWAPNGKVRAAFSFTFKDDRIVDIELIAEPSRLQALGVVLLDE
ncbi:MAG TPA: sigma-70 family RNA polymerase sigma factor [Spirochaetia bacterium]|nr:sigma-70 family RNA polymerase sigma factor [Spirochaetia bacterium]